MSEPAYTPHAPSATNTHRTAQPRIPSRWSALLIHGAGGGGWEWNVWRAVLDASGITATAPDLEPAAAGIAATTFEDYCVQMAEVLAALPRPRTLVGASLGGLIAQRLAGQADALVLVNSIPPAPWHGELPQRHWPDIVRWRGDARLASTRRALSDTDPASALFAFRHWRDESGQVLRQAHAGVALAPVPIPTLCIASDLDDDVPPAVARALANAWHADLLVEGDCSHVGTLLGRDAARIALHAAGWLSRR